MIIYLFSHKNYSFTAVLNLIYTPATNRRHRYKCGVLPERSVLPKTYPRTIALTSPTLIYTASFQIYLSIISKMSFISDSVYVFESACIECVYAITHMSVYPLYMKYNQLCSQIYCQCMFYKIDPDKSQHMAILFQYSLRG